MKKMFLLVDMGNCRFMICKKSKEWNLPILKKVRDTTKIEKVFFEKYQLNIYNPKVIEEDGNYVLVKAYSRDNLSNGKYTCDVINNLYSIIIDSQQKNILFNISKKIFCETINDSFWLGIILTVESNLNDLALKYILSDFLLFFSSIFCEETIKYNFGEIKNENSINQSIIKNLRKSYLKECPLYESNKVKTIINSMGIDFDNYVFDIVVFLTNNGLLDINSRMWDKSNNDSRIYNSIIMSPRNWIKNHLPNLENELETVRKRVVDELLVRFKKLKVKRKSYSTYKLFNTSMIYNEKIYILQRIGLLKTIMMISNIIEKGTYISVNGELLLSFDKFMMKVKATIIEIIWNDKKCNNIPFLNNILENLPKEIPDNFYAINRKCRDNIHYGFYNILNEDENKILNDNQDLYLSYVVNEMEKKVSFKFSFGYKIALMLAKLQYWSSN